MPTIKVANLFLYYNITALGADLSGWDGNKVHKYIPEETVDEILDICSELAPHYPIFRHTSCAISYFFGSHDYNFHFYKNQACVESCINKDKCANKMRNLNVTKIEEKDINNALRKIGCPTLWDRVSDSKCILVRDEMSQEQISSLMHYLQIPINAKKIRKSMSEEVFVE